MELQSREKIEIIQLPMARRKQEGKIRRMGILTSSNPMEKKKEDLEV